MKALLAAATLALSALPAAAAITYDFQNGNLGGNGSSPVFSATRDGLSVDVTAGLYEFGPGLTPILTTDCSVALCSDDRVVSKRRRGLGIDDPAGGGNTDRGVIDGRDANDLITFTFDKVVSFGSVLFTRAGRSDEVDIFVEGVLVALNTEASGGPVDLSGLRGQAISFGADERNDNFRVGAVIVAAIPLPAAGLILLTALGGAAATFRQRRRA